jgi:hypothetical protein
MEDLTMRTVSLLFVFGISVSVFAAAPDYRKLYTDNRAEIEAGLKDSDKLRYPRPKLGLSMSGKECKQFLDQAAATSGNPWKLVQDKLPICGNGETSLIEEEKTNQLGLGYNALIRTNYPYYNPYEYYILLNTSTGLIVESGIAYSSLYGDGASVVYGADATAGFHARVVVDKVFGKDRRAYFARSDVSLSAERHGEVGKETQTMLSLVVGDKTYVIARRTNGNKETCFAGKTVVDKQSIDYVPSEKAFNSCRIKE